MTKIFLSSELQVILACLRLSANQKKINNIKLLCQERINWLEFLNQANKHRVTSLIYQVIKDNNISCIPKDVLQQMGFYHTVNTHRCLNMTAELVTVTKLFNRANINCLSLKGPILSQQLYGKLNSRESCDIDLLISSNQLGLAHQLLLLQGYKCLNSLIFTSKKKLNYYLTHKKNFLYYHPASQIYLELHWRLFDDCQIHPVDIKKFLRSIIKEKISTTYIHTFSFESNLLYLLIHGAQHAWQQLGWLADINQLICNNEINWDSIFYTTKKLSLELYIQEGLFLIHHLMNTSVPYLRYSNYNSNKKMNELLNIDIKIINLPSYGHKKTKLLRLIRHYKIQGFKKFVIYMFKQIFVITPKDLEEIQISDKFFFFYYLFRPLMWINRKFF